jgi:hypothetical protein
MINDRDLSPLATLDPFSTLADHAGDCADQALREAKYNIDLEFGEGFAKNNPELVIEMIKSYTQIYVTGFKSQEFCYCKKFK